MFEVTLTTGSGTDTDIMTFKGESLQDIIAQVTQVVLPIEGLEDEEEDLDDLEDFEECCECGNFEDLMDTLYSNLHNAADLNKLQEVDVYSKAIQRLLSVV